MNRAIVSKFARDTLGILTIILLGVCGLELVFVVVIGDFAKELEFLWLNKAFFQRFAKMLVGSELGTDLSATSMLTIGYAHPILFAMTWGYALAHCSRVIVGEIEQGTVDLLLTLPVSRGSIYLSVSLVWMAAGIPICLATILGTWGGHAIAPMWEPVEFDPLIIVMVNFYILYLCIGCVTMGVASFCVRRGPVICIVLAWLLGSFFLNFIAQLWWVAQKINWLSVLQYYRPLPVVRDHRWPIEDIITLLVIAAVFWSAGLWRYTRRDLPAA